MSDVPDDVAQPAPPEEIPPLDLSRSTLIKAMPPEHFDQIVDVTHALLERRFAKVQGMVDVASSDVNVNPFLMLAMAPAYNIFSPYEAAEYAQNAKLPHGDATAFGRFVEERIFPIFGTKSPAEKGDPETAALFSPIDQELSVEGTGYLATYKAGPWTMNQTHANEMIHRFPEIHDRSGCEIIIGITYGKRERVNNKPAKVMRETGPYVHTLVGQNLWEFITGVEDAHFEVFRAIRKAQKRFAVEHEGKTFYEHLIEARLRLADSFRKAFGLVGGAEEDMWEQIFKGSF